ncbi:cation diffusion facilitator family transporter [Paenibacillus sp. FSL R5-0527]|uniref:cation diffusion facilitator family transporter n=1 Tax=Paenibacillus TaxID=44249 RepID=UPI00097B2BF5|nr:cation diffusion facilitator family transporter [Paenibacillus macerans]MBS5911965.1 cation diffusion facilitator family transporter [Paenibacillus macerans]OMG46969.1 cation-efflux pump [Paenibacillus macerans]GIP12097.1 cation transporter [Paenibacillus macerans]
MKREHAAFSDSAAWLSIVSHAALAVFKGMVGLWFDSRALLAAALHSASDAAAEIAAKVEWPGLRKRRALHAAYVGREGVEPLLAIFFAVFLLMGGLQMMIAAISNIARDELKPPEVMAGVAVVVSFALKEAVFQFRFRQSRKEDPKTAQSLIATHRYSLYSSVAAFIGVFGAVAGQAMGVSELLYLDPLAAFFIACLVFWRAYRLIRESLYGRLVSAIQEEDATSFIETVQRVHGVIAVDELKAQENGHYVIVDAKISVNPRITVMEANDIANRAKMLLLNRFSHVSEVRIQVAPYDAGYPYKSNAEENGSDLPNLLQ